ncbi:anaphase promoting complex subunit cdc16 [Tulasnella sp. 419]|nr:anaphase promoting complex subunit cdc16 [Tulasnella sp. 419]
MAQTPPPPANTFAIPMPPLPNRGPRVRPRQSQFSSASFSLGPESLVQAMNFGGPSPSDMSIVEEHHRDPNASIIAASPRQSGSKRGKGKGILGRKIEQDVSILGHEERRFQPYAFSTPAPAGSQGQIAKDALGNEERGELDEEDWSIVDRMRLWRHDAMMQHLHESAVFWGDKILSWTGDPNDAFWLAQAHFLNQQYSRAEQLLTRPFVVGPRRPENKASGKGKERARLETNGFLQTNGPATPVAGGLIGGIQFPGDVDAGTVSKLVDMSVACRYLAAQCMVRAGRWTDAIEILGESNPFRGSGRSGPNIPNSDGGIKVEASMCYLRGVLMTRLNRQDRAKEHFMEALALDVKCFDAFNELVNGNLLGIDEEWDFVQGLEFLQQVPEDADFVRLVYTIRLKKQKHVSEMALARQRLVEEYGMSENPDVLFAFAESMYAQYRWEDAFAITSRIMELVGIHPAALPTHIACMHNLRHLHPRLFLLAHELVDKDPDDPVSWYAVGVYYLLTKKFLDARKFFSKANLMDPRFGPAWIGFAHSYAYEGEHDHAIVAYSTAARLFPGMHLPALFLAMEYLQVNNLALAGEYLDLARTICDTDPLLHNERGVLAFHRQQYALAAGHFEQAIALTKTVQGTNAMWATTYLNLGQAYRKLGRLIDAKAAFVKVLELNPRHGQGFACLGLVHHVMGEYDQAIRNYHESLAIDPLDTNTIDLLNLALEINAEMPPGVLGVIGFPGGDEHWLKMMQERLDKATEGGLPPVGSQKEGIYVDELGAPSVIEGNPDSSAMEM